MVKNQMKKEYVRLIGFIDRRCLIAVFIRLIYIYIYIYILLTLLCLQHTFNFIPPVPVDLISNDHIQHDAHKIKVDRDDADESNSCFIYYLI